jgi:hypothetical protein
MTYRTSQSYVYLQKFPDFHAVSKSDFESWNKEHWKKTSYGIDTRYNKGHFAEQAISIKDWLGGRTFEERILECCTSSDPTVNFHKLGAEINTIYKYGRMTTWLTLQCMYDTLGLNINPNTVQVDDPGNKSCYNGAIFMSGKHELIAGKHNHVTPGYGPSKEDRAYAEEVSKEFWNKLKIQFPEWDIDAFRYETLLCQHKKMCVTSNEYFGLSVGEATETYEWLAEKWPEVDRKQYCKALIVPIHPCLHGKRNMKGIYTDIFMKYGVFINEHYLDENAPNVYEHLEIPPTPLVDLVLSEAKDYGYLK